MSKDDKTIEVKDDKTIELSEAELADIHAQAELELEAEVREELKAEALAQAKASIKAKKLAREGSRKGKAGTRMVQINLGKHSDRIVIDGRTYLQGRSYPLTSAQEETIRDMAFRTHLHQAELRGKNFLRDFYGARPVNATI